MQLGIDFDTPAVETAPPPPVTDLTLELSAGEVLTKVLKPMDTTNRYNTGYVTFTPQGIFPTEIAHMGNHHYSEMIPYPKGVNVQGKTHATIELKPLLIVLGRKPKHANSKVGIPDGMGSYEWKPDPLNRFADFYGLAKTYCKIVMNSKVKITAREFTAILKTNPEPEPEGD